MTTDVDGKFSHQFQLTGGTWKVVATAGSLWVEVKEPNSKSFKKLASAQISADGSFKLSVRPWMKPSYRVTAKRNGAQIAITEVGATTPTFKAVKRISEMPEPRVRFPIGQTPIGAKSNTVVRSIPNSVWRSMQGLSWRRGCVARSRLALVETNYMGFDGYRHRGKILVQRAIGKKTKRIFTKFYNAKFPIRQMQLVDVFGKNVGGRPGANDYKSMAADNTSAFNCRFVVGKEGSGTRSPHASGRSLDIYTWENPYVVGRSVFPNRSYLNRRAKHPAMFKGGSKALKIMRSAGCRWGGSYADYHHFDC